MAASHFTTDFNGSADDLVAKVKTAIEGAGGTLTGDATGGSLSISTPLGKVEGRYAISGQSAAFTIDSKPALVPTAAIETRLRDLLAG